MIRLITLSLVFCCFYLHAVGNPVLLFANRKDVRLLDTEKRNSTVIVRNLEDATAVDYDFHKRLVFWTEVAYEKIKRMTIDSSKVSVVIKADLVAPDGLACDWIATKLYWTDSETNRIETSHYDGRHRKVLFWSDLDQPRAIAVDPYHGYVYWTDWGEVPKIERGGMDGDQSSRSVIVSDNIYWPNGLAIDYDESKIYWADAKLSYIHSCDYDGSNRRTVLEGNLDHPFALTLLKDEIYWTDWKDRAIHRCSKKTGKGCTIVEKNIYSPMDIHVYSRDRQKPGVNPCGANNGGCSHLCLMSPTSPQKYRCACPTGVRLQADSKTCADGPDNILLLARRTDLRRISLDMPDYTDMVLQLDDLKHAIALDFDPVEKFVYWTDDGLQMIKRAKLDGSEESVIVTTEVEHPDGIAVDWVARNLYWTDTGTDRIEVSRLNGSSRRVVISKGLDQPRAISLDPTRGFMYWTDWGEAPKIERANLDGSNRVVLLSGSTLGWPNGLAIDIDSQMLFWGDGKKDRIEVVRLVGDTAVDRRVLVDRDLPHIFGFTLLGRYIYWTDWQRRSIERVNATGGERQVIVDQLPDLMGLKAVNMRSVKGDNPCAHNNGNCSHLCLYRPPPWGPTCACPINMDLTKDNLTCVVPDALLLVTTHSGIQRISIDMNNKLVPIPVSGLAHVLAMDYDKKEKRLYWSDQTAKSLSRAFMNGSYSERVIESGVEQPDGLAVDWIAENIYWCDQALDRIEVARLDGSSRRVLIWRNIEKPRTVALDPQNGYFYWSSWGDTRTIERASLDGTSRSVIIRNIGWVHGLTIDYERRQIYWADYNRHKIETAQLDGKQRRTLLVTGQSTPFCLTLYGPHVYWTSLTVGKNQSIIRADKITGHNWEVIRDDLVNVMTIAVFHSSRQSGSNSCAVNNGGCQHLCLARSNRLPSNKSFQCSCPTHFKLNTGDLRTCSPPRRFLLFSHRSSISRMLFDPKAAPDIALPISGLRNVEAIEYDPVDRFLYWIDSRAKSIRRALEDGSKTRTIITNTNSFNVPHDLSLDPYTRHIYWSCEQTNTIIVTRFDGIEVGPIIGDNEQKPRFIVIHPEKGLIFWTNELASSPRIERAAMDGTEHVVLFSTGIRKIGALAIDRHDDFIYWSDVILKRIERADLNGGNREVVVDKNVQNPRGVTVSKSYIFWIDREQNLIERVSKSDKSIRASVPMRLDQLSDVHAVEALSKAALHRHACYVKNGGCTHICVVKEDGRARCSCPIGLVLSKDMVSCSDPPTCGSDQFTCVSGNIDCIPKVWRCDGFTECEDRSDEANCPVCRDERFSCGDDVCINADKVCNGIRDCKDGVDEEDCCKIGERKCHDTNVCIPKDKRCDDPHALTVIRGKSGKGQRYKTSGGRRVSHEDGADDDDVAISRKKDSSPSVHMTVIVIVSAVVVIVVVFVLYICCRKSAPNNTVVYYDPLATNKLASDDEYVALPNAQSKSLVTASNSLVYDRNHVTGASSSSSTATHYPKETLNPPPSPITVRSSQFTANHSLSSTSISLPRSRSHRRRHAPPSSTTDPCDEREPCVRARYNYDAGPYPPPPTPHYFSEELSCPPSPATERSFFHPKPPPPSLVANSDC